MNGIYFEVISNLDKRVYVTKSRWSLIIKTKHLEIEGKEKEIKETLTKPHEIGKAKAMLPFTFISKVMENYRFQLL